MSHDFQESLAKSQAQADSPIWESIYRRAFPNFENMTNIRGDGWAQRGGIDRLVVLASGKTLTVDEKVRDKDYDDILLEYWSNAEQKSPGWVAKDLACDYIAYAFIPSARCYLLPFQQLRVAWRKHRREWVNRYFISKAPNKGYTTVGVCVPIPILMDAIKEALVIDWDT